MSLSQTQRAYLHASLPHRSDARKPLHPLPRTLARAVYTHASGSAQVQRGNDTVTVGISVECEAEEDSDNEEEEATRREKEREEGEEETQKNDEIPTREKRKGRVVVDVEATSVPFETDEEKIDLQDAVEEILNDQSILSLEEIQAPKGQKWIIYVDALIMGAVVHQLDSLYLAIYIALHDTKIPLIVNDEITEDSIQLDCSKLPLAITLHRIGDHTIIDPTPEESICSEFSLTLFAKQDETVAIRTGGNSGAYLPVVNEMIETGKGVLHEFASSLEAWLPKLSEPMS